jgi:hypothetical protein
MLALLASLYRNTNEEGAVLVEAIVRGIKESPALGEVESRSAPVPA